jgi:two-component sensor histidine kinase/DNA-binding NarL/FixJ family response regulator/putative methionine-R-sulfoxide reductase with GAF domain
VLKVLIAENDLLMADMLEEVITEGGFEVCGIGRNVKEALALARRHSPDIALLDLRLAHDELGTDIAAGLDRSRGLGILYATGNSHQFLLTKDDGDACLDKPFRPADVIRALHLVHEIASAGKASKPFPSGFRLLERADKTATPHHTAASHKNGKDARDIDIARLLRQQAALAAFGSFALGESDLGKVLTEAARVCAESLDVPFCKVCRYRADQNDLLIEAGVGWKSGVVGGVVSRADKSSPQGRAFITGEPVICADLSKDTSFLLPAFYAEHAIVSTLDVVIKKKDGQPWGVLEIDNPRRHVYDEHDVVFVTGFANVLAEAVNTSKRNAIVQDALNQMKDMVADRDRLLAAQERLLAEKVVLAQELQHRVRNNLHLVYGMLNKQIASPGDTSDTVGISAIARRVMTLSKVYDHLLGTDLTRTIDFGSYLKSLCDGFRDLEDEQHKGVDLTCKASALMLDLDTATALGLIVAELLSNSYLHAFPTDTGKINVLLTLDHSGKDATIKYSDDGVGYKDTGQSKRRGLGLVKRLMEQVDGSAEVHSDIGTTWDLTFPIHPEAAGHGANGTA